MRATIILAAPSERGSGASATLVRPAGPGRDRRPGPNLPPSPPTVTDRAGTHCRDRLACSFEPSGPLPSLPRRLNVDPAHQPRLCAGPVPDGTDFAEQTHHCPQFFHEFVHRCPEIFLSCLAGVKWHPDLSGTGLLAITTRRHKVPELPGDPELDMHGPNFFYEFVHRCPEIFLGHLEGVRWRPGTPVLGFLAASMRRQT